MKSIQLCQPQSKRRLALAVWLVPAALMAIGTAVPRVLRPEPMNASQLKSGRNSVSRRPDAGSTSSLFTYRRDDTAPNGITQIRIDASHTAAAPIHQELFGNFIEHLGGVVYPGLWAQVLLNPNLEAVDTPRGEMTTPPEWQTNTLALWRPGSKEMHGYHSPGYITLLAAPGPSSTPGALSQIVYLPVHRVRTFSGTIAVRVVPEADNSPEKEPPQSSLRVAIFSARGRANAVTETRLRATSTEWTSVPFRLTVPDGTLAKGAAARFTVEHSQGATVDIDRIELFPTDSVDGVDPDVLTRAREWHMPLVRWPGGNFASGYHWTDGVGRRADRPTRRNAAWGGVESNEFGTDEFLAFCRRLGTRPQLTVNAGDGTPEEAANWVRYCNASATNRFGRMRAANGHPKPYDVRLWEVGNELYGDWQIGHTVPDENAQRFVRFRDALLKADPKLQLIATGKADEFLPDGLARNAAWNDALLRAAMANGGRAPEYLSVHPLVPLPGSLERLTYSEQYESAMAHTAFMDRTLLPDLWERIVRYTGPNSRTRIAVTEWGLIVGGRRWQEGPNHDTLAGAVYNALCLNTMLRHSDHVTLANMTAFMHGGGIKKPNGIAIVDPQYYTQQLYSVAKLQTPVRTETVGPGADVPERGFLPGVADVPDVDVFAALDRSGRKLVVCAVNRRETVSRAVELKVDGFHTASAEAALLSAASPTARNTIVAPNAVAPRQVSISSRGSGGARSWSMALPPHSVTVLTLSR